MKRTILAVSLAILALAAPLRADRVTVAVTVTGAPTHGVTFVLNGDSRSWVTNSPSATQFLISSNGASANATNFYNAIAARLFAGQITVQQTATNVVKLYGSGSQAMVASLPGTWGTLTVTTNASTDLTAVRVPVSSEPTAATRTNIGTQLAEAINSFSTNRLLISVLPVGLDTNPGASYLGKTSNAVSATTATTANTASNALLLNGLTFPTILTNGQSGVSLYSTTPGTVDNGLLVNAGFVRSLLTSGTFFYNSSNLVAGSFIRGVQAFQYQPTVDATISTRTYSGVTNNQYIGATMTTQTFTSVSGPATIEAYLTSASGSATVSPEIYFTIDGTNTWGDYAGAGQTITTGTNLYSWVMSFPTTTTNVPFRVVRQFKVISQTSNPDITLSVGGVRDSRISFGIPNTHDSTFVAINNGTATNLTVQGTLTAPGATATGTSNVANVGAIRGDLDTLTLQLYASGNNVASSNVCVLNPFGLTARSFGSQILIPSKYRYIRKYVVSIPGLASYGETNWINPTVLFQIPNQINFNGFAQVETDHGNGNTVPGWFYSWSNFPNVWVRTLYTSASSGKGIVWAITNSVEIPAVWWTNANTFAAGSYSFGQGTVISLNTFAMSNGAPPSGYITFSTTP